MKSARKGTKKPAQTPRTNKIEFKLNDEEFKLLAFYMKKYKLTNRSRCLREAIVTHIFQKLDMDYPTLFDENEMRR